MDFSLFKAVGKFAINDFPTIEKSINNQAHAARVPPCALAAIIMRESAGRNIFQEGVPHDDPNCGYGYAQITYGANRSDPEHPTFVLNGKTYDLFDPSSNLYIAAQAFLGPAISNMLALRQSVSMPNEILYYAFGAYNAGFAAVARALHAGEDVDSVTTDNYASGTLALYHDALG
jgi:hypothetical protein